MYNDYMDDSFQSNTIESEEITDNIGRAISPGISGGIVIVPGVGGIGGVGVCRVRFLNAADNYAPLRISIGSRLITNSLSYMNITEYTNISVGFRSVTISSASSPRTILYQRTIPFNSGEIITLAIIRTLNGIDLLRISDADVTNGFMGRGSVRMANLVFNSPPLDLFLANHRAIFSDVRYKEVTQAKQANAKEYEMYIAQTNYIIEPRYSDIEVIEDMPIVSSYNNFEPIVSFTVNVKPGVMSTIYVFGSWRNSIQLRVIDNR